MKYKAPQSELPVIGTQAFNLFSEVAVDGGRLQKEAEANAERAREAKEIEKKQQPNLI
jgi:hypothetical protein